MTRYLQLTTVLAERIAQGRLAVGAALPSVRELAAQEATTPATVRRAYQELAESGAIVVEPRRSAKVAANGAVAARSLLRGVAPFRLAGSDDPALALLTSLAPEAVVAVGGAGSYTGLSSLWSGHADGASLHLRHRSGEYNRPFALGVLAGRSPVLVHLWSREQGLVVPAGNPAGIRGFADLDHGRAARRVRGTGTRALHDRLLIEAGIAPEQVSGPEVRLHLDVALAVSTGEADAGLAVRSVAATLGLGFVPVASEPFQIATTEKEVGGLQPLLRALRDPEVAARIRGLGGYDLAGAGEVVPVA